MESLPEPNISDSTVNICIYRGIFKEWMTVLRICVWINEKCFTAYGDHT